MKAHWWGYVIAFLLGWSGAVLSYSDLIYMKVGKPEKHISGKVSK